ncbi:hypothetical protein BASA81_008566 [Batrachochytrium salamandrivorans]|nr:hypothetical protein BASA81_008566 [Batrachochytrium salamandrivorans]
MSSPSSQIYLEQCAKLQVKVDQSVLASLSTEWHVLQIAPSTCHEGCLLPLVPVLQSKECAITTLRLLPARALRRCRLDLLSGDVDARVLREILRVNTSITELDISFLGIGPAGIKELADMLVDNRTLLKLRLAHNPGHRKAYKEIARALKENSSLQVLDLSSNRLGFDTIQHLRKAASKSNTHIITHGNNVIEENLNTATHLVGFGLATIAVVALLIRASVHVHLFWSCLVYGLTLLAMFSSSAMFHSQFDAKVDHYEFWKMCDHSAIYLLIAGSMTPFVVMSTKYNPVALAVSCFQWSCAVFGIAFGMYAGHHSLKHKLKIEMGVNFAQGFSALLVYQDLLKELGQGSVDMLAASGMCYVVGALFFVGEHTVHPVSHAIWHLFVIAGATLHYFAVYKFTCQF